MEERKKATLVDEGLWLGRIRCRVSVLIVRVDNVDWAEGGSSVIFKQMMDDEQEILVYMEFFG